MTAPVALVTVHHEGAGAPTDSPRGAAGGYTYWIGTTRFTLLRTPWESYATLGFNHVSLDVCLSGDRMTYPVTGVDTNLIRAAVTDARARGFVVDAPLVRAHRNSPGSATVCPGNCTMAKWNAVVSACTKPAGADPAPTAPEPDMPLFPSKTKPATHFRGARVDVAARRIDLIGGATMVPPQPPNEPYPWLGAYDRTDGVPGFVIAISNDLNEFKYTLP